MKKCVGELVAAVLLLVLAHTASAENSQRFGEYTVHYNAFSSDTLPADVARQYGFVRSKNRGLLNITVLRGVSPQRSGEAVTALVSASASNLSGQLKDLTMREVREREAIYYIGQFRVADEETLSFTVDVRPKGDSDWHRVAFDQQFFTR